MVSIITAMQMIHSSLLFMSFLSDQPSATLGQLELCICEVRIWMFQKMLMLKENKNVVMIFSLKTRLPFLRNLCVQVGDNIVTSASLVRNLDARMSTCMSMDTRINYICRSSNMHLKTVSRLISDSI